MINFYSRSTRRALTKILISDEFSPCTGCLAGCSQCRDCIHCIDHPDEEGCDKCQHCEPCIGCAACVSGDCPAYEKCTDCTLCMPCLKDRNLPGCDKVSSRSPTQFLENYFSVLIVPLVQKLLDVSTIQPPTQNMYLAWMPSPNWTTIFRCRVGWSWLIYLHWESDTLIQVSYHTQTAFATKWGRNKHSLEIGPESRYAINESLIKSYAINESLNSCYCGSELVLKGKRGRVFPVVIWPAFRMGQYSANDHPPNK